MRRTPETLPQRTPPADAAHAARRRVTAQGQTRYTWPAPLYPLRPDWAPDPTGPPPGTPALSRPVRPVWEPVRPSPAPGDSGGAPVAPMPSYTDCFQGF